MLFGKSTFNFLCPGSFVSATSARYNLIVDLPVILEGHGHQIQLLQAYLHKALRLVGLVWSCFNIFVLHWLFLRDATRSPGAQLFSGPFPQPNGHWRLPGPFQWENPQILKYLTWNPSCFLESRREKRDGEMNVLKTSPKVVQEHPW